MPLIISAPASGLVLLQIPVKTENNIKLLLNRIDYTGRIAVKVEDSVEPPVS